MPTPHRTILAASSLFLTAAAIAQPCNFSAADAAAADMVARRPLLPGAAILVGDRDGILHEAYFGSYNASTVVAIASATKLLSGVAIMTLVDDGLIGLDTPVSNYLTEFNPQDTGLKSTMTPRQMFAHISGLPGQEVESPILNNPFITLATASRQIACCVDLEVDPGTSFAYGGLSMHVTGRIAEVVSGQRWEPFFASSLSTPLGLTTIDYQGLGPTFNPRISGAARSNLRDYGTVLAMLLRRGEVNGVRILSESAVDSMITDVTEGLPRRGDGPGTDTGWGYGFGGWVSRKDDAGNTLEFTSPGAFGFTPWVDYERGIYAIIMVQSLNSVLSDDLDAIKLAIEASFDACNCPADWDGSGGVDGDDIAAFFADWQQGTADIDGSGGTDGDDIAFFFTRWQAGC